MPSQRLAIGFAAFALAACAQPAPSGGGDVGAPDAGPLAATPATVTALHYEVALDLSSRAAASRVTLRIDAPGSCATLGFLPAAVADVRFDGAPAEPADTKLDAAAGTLTACRAGHLPWKAGDTTIFAATNVVPATTLSTSQVGFSTTSDLGGRPFTYLLSWVNGCDHHGPCDAAPERFATYKFLVTAPPGTHVLCPGAVTVAGAVTTCDFTADGGPTYSTYGVAASPGWSPKSLGTWAGVGVTLYDYAESGIGAAFDTAVAAKHLAWLQGLLGPYPYGNELRYAVGPTYWLGFEHPGNIVLSESLVTSQARIAFANPLRHVAMHELTHQWAGDHATLAGTYDFFWKESVAEYLTYVFEDEQIARADAAVTSTYWKRIAEVSKFYPSPAERPPLFTYYGDAYGEGPMIVFRQLEVMFGRKAILAALTALLSSASPARAVSVEDLRRALEAATGAKLDGYFKAWVYGAGAPAWPTAKLTTKDLGGGSWRLAVDVSTADGVARGCDFTVRLLGDGGRAKDVLVKRGVDGAPFPPAIVQTGFVVKDTRLDPDNQCLIFPAAATQAIAPDAGRGFWVAPR